MNTVAHSRYLACSIRNLAMEWNEWNGVYLALRSFSVIVLVVVLSDTYMVFY